MSTGLECNFIETKPGEWFYVLQDWNCPVGAWDWREYATAYGPFPTEEKANEHLRDNHANPGGYTSIPFEEGFEPDEALKGLIAKAEPPAQARNHRQFYRW